MRSTDAGPLKQLEGPCANNKTMNPNYNCVSWIKVLIGSETTQFLHNHRERRWFNRVIYGRVTAPNYITRNVVLVHLHFRQNVTRLDTMIKVLKLHSFSKSHGKIKDSKLRADQLYSALYLQQTFTGLCLVLLLLF